MDLSELEIDEEKAEGGVFLAYPESDARFKIRWMGSKAVRDSVTPKMRRIFRDAGRGTLEGDEAQTSLADWVARQILSDWGNITKAGAPVPYTPDGASEILSMKGFAPVVNWIFDRCVEESNFRKDPEEEGDLGNSPISSPGT